MDLIMTFFEDIYRYGNVTVSLITNVYKIFINKDNKLSIEIKTIFDNDDDYEEIDNDDIERTLVTIFACLVEDSLNPNHMIMHNVKFDTFKTNIIPDDSLPIINMMYRMILPFMLINYDYMKKLIESDSLGNIILNQYSTNKEVISLDDTLFSYDTIYRRLLRKTNFLSQMYKLGVIHSNVDKSAYASFLSKLYINQYVKRINTDDVTELDSIDIHYEFLTDKFYETDPAKGRDK